MRAIWTYVVLFTTTLLGAISDAHSQDVTLFTGGKILTVDADFLVAEAMAIKGDRILAVGSEVSVRKSAGRNAKTVDLKGNAILPGFIDAHTHPLAGGAGQVFENVGVDRFRSIEAALNHMRRAGAKAKQADWMLFINLDLATQTYEKPKLTAEVLDTISGVAPVVVWHAGGHRMTVNSRMLKIMDVSARTPNPKGAEYGRYANGEPDGNVAGSAALFATLAKITPYKSYDRKAGAIALGRKWLSQGTTTLGIAGVASPEDWKVLTELAKISSFPLRTRSYLQWGALPLWDQARIKPGIGDADARVIGWKISADGSNQAFTGLQRAPYLNRNDNGLAYMTQADVNKAVVRGTKRGGQMAMHGNGDAGIDNIITAVAAARAQGVDVKRPRIEHCSIVQDDQLEKLIKNKISCSFLIAHVLYWGQAFRDKVFGPEKAAKLDRAGSFERAGIPFSLHTDYGVSELSPLEMAEVAVARTLFTEPDFVLGPDERASIEAAIRSITSVPAWQLMSENEIGSLEPGKLADFVILASDPREVKPNHLGEIQVLQTWIDGKRVH